jgi:ATP-dependent helicase HepA
MAQENRLNDYQEKIHGIQALRRKVEMLNSPYQGATGIKAQFYPHQLQTVKRILCDTQIRHLIADEVGLGKTVQSLMIMNALRLQRSGRLRTTILVPEEQQARQWSDEIWARAHLVPFAESGEPPGLDWVQVFWNAKILQPHLQLAPDRFDLLIVDELQSITKTTLQVIIRNAKRYQHLLVLTATPNLHSNTALFELMQLLEPDRIELCQEPAPVDENLQTQVQQKFDWEPEKILEINTEIQTEREFDPGSQVATTAAGEPTAFPDEEKTNILNRLRDFGNEQRKLVHEKADVSGIPSSRLERIFDRAWWFLRKIIRSRRIDYPCHLPRRKHQNRIIEPLQSESERLQITTKFLRGFLDREGDRERATQVARRAVIGGQSLRDRINEFQRAGRDPNNELAKPKEYCEAEWGNSRLDELIDFLNQQWQQDPNRKILIAAAVNPAIDFLYDRISELLPYVGPKGKRRPLIIMKFRLTRDNAEEGHDLIDAYIQDREYIAPFTMGNSQLAIAHSSFRQNYNFQMADALVFYDLPWTPDHIDQWIGRVDRLGRETMDPEQPHTPPVPVEIVSIGWRGEFDEQMVQVYDSSRVFERPLQLDPLKTSEISKAIFSAGLGLDKSLWNDLKTKFENESDNQDQISAEQPAAFGTPELAAEMFNELRKSTPAFPMIAKKEKLGGYVSSNTEDALARWLMLLKIQGYYNFFLNKKQATEENNRSLKFFTLSQNRSVTVGRLNRIEGYENPKWVPFFFVRKHVQRPPRTTVALETDGEAIHRHLEFLDHGSILHDEMIATWIQIGSKAHGVHGQNLHSFKVYFNADHLPTESKLEVNKRYFLIIGHFDPCRLIEPEAEAVKILDLLEPSKNKIQERMRKSEEEQCKLDIESEVRFARINIGSRICFYGIKYEKGFPEIDDDTVRELTTPFWGTRNPPICLDPKLKESEIQQFPLLLSKLKSKMENKTRNENSTKLGSIKAIFQDRKMQLELETLDRIAVINKNLEAVKQKIIDYTNFGGIRNENIITTQFKPRAKLLEEQIDLTRKRLQLRQSILDRCLLQLEAPSLEIHTGLDVNVKSILPA